MESTLLNNKMENKQEYVILGLSVMGLSVLLLLLSLLVTRILSKMHRGGGPLVTIQTWLYFSATLEQLCFGMFHIKYNILHTDFEVPDSCIVLRFMMTFCSTLMTMRLLVISVFYLMLTIKPEKCLTFHFRVLAHCVVWCWCGVSCLLYLILAFLVQRRQHQEYMHSCWENIHATIHMYNTNGNEVIPLVVAIVCSAMARIRISSHRRQLEVFLQKFDFHLDIRLLFKTINRNLVLLSFLALLYVVLLFHYLYDTRGSDLLLMLLQASRGVAIATITCFCDNSTLAIFRCRREPQRETKADTCTSNGKGQTKNTFEMKTYRFLGHEDN